MKKQIFSFGCAVVLAAWTCSAHGDYGAPSATNSPLPRLETWHVYPAEPSQAAVVTTSNTNTIVGLDSTNAPTAPPPPAVVAPPAPAPGSADPEPNTIQSTPTLQGTEAGKGPI